VPPKRTPFLRFFFGALRDFMLRLLLVCAALAFAIEMGFAEGYYINLGKVYQLRLYLTPVLAWIEGVAIFLGVVVVAAVSSWNDYKKEE